MSFFDFIVPHYKDKYLNSILVSLLFNSKFNSLLSNNINNSSDNLFQKFIKELLNFNLPQIKFLFKFNHENIKKKL